MNSASVRLSVSPAGMIEPPFTRSAISEIGMLTSRSSASRSTSSFEFSRILTPVKTLPAFVSTTRLW